MIDSVTTTNANVTTTNANVTTTNDFLNAWSTTESLLAAFREVMADNIVWETVGLSRTVGLDAALSAMTTTMGEPVRGFDVEVHHVAAVGNTVLTERFERLLAVDGSIIFEATVAAVFDFDSTGKISAWREYQDTIPFAAMANPA
nr:limonene-1,2-epoxide hydrolase family protein [Rhodococcus sp. (in: high G+C Gram-positive bacteria)]